MKLVSTFLGDDVARRRSAYGIVTRFLVVATVLTVLSSVTVPASGARTLSGLVDQTGLHVFALNGRPYGIDTAIHVLTFNGPHYSLTVGLARNEIDGGLQTTSSMCQDTPGCVAAVNGDFFDFTQFGAPDPGDEVGGVIKDCVLLHTPEIAHQQIDLDGRSVSNGLNWSSILTINGVTVPITAVNQELPLSYRGVSLPLRGTLLYTLPYALATPAAAGRVTYEFTQEVATASATTINATATLTYAGQTTQPVRVGPGDVDVSAVPNSAFATLQPGQTVTLTTTSTAGCDNIGGHPILLDQGVAEPIVATDAYMVKPYARSVIGWKASGVTVLMTVNGQDAVSGATAYQLERVLESLGVVTALAFDGGNSTTFFAEGRVLNTPSRGSEHPVSTSILVVRNPSPQ